VFLPKASCLHGKVNLATARKINFKKAVNFIAVFPRKTVKHYDVYLVLLVTDICTVIMSGGQWKATCSIILFFTTKNNTTKDTTKTQFQPSLCFFVSMRQVLNMKSNSRIGYHITRLIHW